ncbi:MAG: 16S rRNA (uracil(1498)-N(3))-methyltransferase [Ignavibacteriae bacterium]|nr:16S rRNA (uracil(1498)-N(3))-methyltransferase [Ignavibacteriota bacterium]
MNFSNTEFYYTDPQNIIEDRILILEEEAKHIASVMRYKIGDEILVTDGIGNLFKSQIDVIKKNEIHLTVLNRNTITKFFSNFTFYIPILKFSDRFEFSLEKCVELGIKNFKIFSAEKSQTRGIKIERWKNVLISAMKQSLQTHLPTIEFIELKYQEISSDLNLVFEQNAEIDFVYFLSNSENSQNLKRKLNLFFGPEAGLTKADIDKIPNPVFVNMNKNRLRSETAVISAASILTNILNK